MERYNNYFPYIKGESAESMIERLSSCRKTIREGGCTYRVTFAHGRKAGILDYEGLKSYSIEWVRLNNGEYHFIYDEKNIGKTHNEPTMISLLDKLFK